MGSLSDIIGSVIPNVNGSSPPGTPFLHLDPTDSSSITEITQNSNLVVTDWQDTNGGITYSQASTSSSEFDRTFTVANGLNNLTTMRALATVGNSVLQVANSALGQNVDGVTIGVVVRQAVSDAGGLFYFSRNGSTSNFRSGLSISASDMLLTGGRRLDGDSFQSHSVSITQATWHYVSARFFYSTAEIEVRMDGAVVVTRQAFQTSGNTSNTTSDLSRIGSDFAGRNTQLEFGDILVYHEALSDSDNTDLETFFTDKWAL